MDEARLAARWSGAQDATRRAHRLILESFLVAGAAPAPEAFSEETLRDLAARDLAHVRDGRIAIAYPFSAAPTPFRATVNGVTNFTLCAVDALGVAAMAGRPAEVRLGCGGCDREIRLRVAADGLTVEGADPAEARIWTGVRDVAGCAADTQCKTMLAFCGPDHLAAWRAEPAGGGRGFDLSLAQGAALGAAIFRPFFARESEASP